MIRVILILLGSAVVVVGVLGLRGQTSTSRPWHIFLDMKYQPRYGAQGQSTFFADGRSSRTPVEGTIPYAGGVTRTDAGDLNQPEPDFLPDADPAYYLGRFKIDEAKFIEHIPKRAVDQAIFSDGVIGYTGWDALLRRGRERYNINCSMCHGETGYGGQGKSAHGIVGRGVRIDPKTGDLEGGMIGIANYHDLKREPRLSSEPDGYLFEVITNGKNTMSSYGHQVPVQDRWAIVAYIRALQLSQNADEKFVDPIIRPRLLGGGK